MTAPRERFWYSFSGTNNALTTSYTAATGIPQGTIQRIIGSILLRTDSEPPAGDEFVFCGWQFNVGTTEQPAIPVGANDPGVMIQRTLVVPTESAATVAISPVPVQTFDIEGQRIVEAGEELWFNAETGQTSVTWLWTYSIRALVLLP